MVVLTRVRAFVLVAAVLLAGLAAVAPRDTRAAGTVLAEAEATDLGPNKSCTVYVQLIKLDKSVGAYALGYCEGGHKLKVTANLKANGTIASSATNYGWTDEINTYTSVMCRSGVKYQAVGLLYVDGTQVGWTATGGKIPC